MLFLIHNHVFSADIIVDKLLIKRKEGNVLFNNALNRFHLWLNGNRPLRERTNPLVAHQGLLFSIWQQRMFLYKGCRVAEGLSHSTASQTNSPMTVWVLIHVQYIPNSVSAKLHQSHDTSPQDIHNGLILCEHTFSLSLYYTRCGALAGTRNC